VRVALATVAVAVVLVAVGVTLFQHDAPDPPTRSDPSLATEMAGDDIFHVGTDVATGTWHTDGPRTQSQQHYNNGVSVPIAAAPCTWGLGHTKMEQGRQSFTTDDGLPPHQEVDPRDVVIPAGSRVDFISENCRTWHLVGAN
jgi:hypothetical protein